MNNSELLKELRETAHNELRIIFENYKLIDFLEGSGTAQLKAQDIYRNLMKASQEAGHFMGYLNSDMNVHLLRLAKHYGWDYSWLNIPENWKSAKIIRQVGNQIYVGNFIK